MSSPASSYPFGFTSSYSSPFGDDQRQRRAASLAEMIRSGALDLDSSPSRSSRRGSTVMSRQVSQQSNGPSPNVIVPQRPLVQSWSDQMLNMEPLPSFVAEGQQDKPPLVKDLIAHSPFIEPCVDQWQPSTHGVILIKNIPYGTLKNEIVSAIGRTAQIVAQPAGTGFEAIHIIMERSTGKTMDCFVELSSEHEAHKIFDRFNYRCATGKAPRIQDRHISIEVSSQADLMRELFPRAKCVTWTGQQPVVFTPSEAYDSGFRGFLTSEEMTMTLKHAQTPGRSPFANKNLQRPYENMISTLNKFPWFSTKYITIEDRCLLFNITSGLLQQLMRSIDGLANPAQLTRELLQQLLCAALTVPFSRQQKANIVSMMHAGRFGEMVETTPYQSLGSIELWWPFEVLDKKSTVQIEVLEYYVALLRQTTTTGFNNSGGGSMQSLASTSPFGNIKLEYGSQDLGSMTLNDVALMETDALQSLLVKAVRTLSSMAGHSMLQHESPDMASGEFRPSDHDVLDKYSATQSPQSVPGLESPSCRSPINGGQFRNRVDSRLVDPAEVFTNHSHSGSVQSQLSPNSLDGGSYYALKPAAAAAAVPGCNKRLPGLGQLNAMSAPFSPRARTASEMPIGHGRGLSSAADSFSPSVTASTGFGLGLGLGCGVVGQAAGGQAAGGYRRVTRS